MIRRQSPSDAARIVGDAMRVHTERPADGKDIDGLHGFDRVFRMQEILNIMPGRAALHGDDLLSFVQLDLIKAFHIQYEIIFIKGMSAHTVLDARH